MSRGARIAGWVGIGIGVGIVLALGAVLLVTRTQWGMERARRFAVSWIDDRIAGELRISRISGGGLLGGATLHGVGIDDPFGRPFVRADSATIAYNWRTLVGGDIVLDEIVLYSPEVYIERMPGDTAWNFEYVFPDTAPGQSTPGRDLILFQQARIVDGLAVIRTPFDPDEAIEPGDTARVVYEQVPAGLLRVVTFDDIEARLSRVLWESPIEPGRLFEIDRLSTRGRIWREPLELRDVRGRVTMRDSVIAFELPTLELPSSRASLVGRVVTGGARMFMDIEVDARQLRFRDLLWLYPELPPEGGGEAMIRIQTQQPKGTLFVAQDASFFAPGTRLAGTLGMVVGDTMYFTRVNLRASPLDVQLIESILPGGLPVDGLLVGTVEVQGPLSALDVDGDVQLQGGASAGSGVRLRGTFDATNNFAVRNVRARVRDFDLGIVERLRPGAGLHGRVDGDVDARTGVGGTVAFSADLRHALTGRPPSRFTGDGTLTRSGAFDVTVQALPLSLTELAAYYPALDGLRGDAAGEIHAHGTARDLAVTADLVTAGGPLHVQANLQRGAGVARYSGYAESARLALDSLHAAAPGAGIAARLDFDLTGNSAHTLAGPVALRLDSAAVGNAVIAGALGAPLLRASGRLDHGLLVVDSARGATDAVAIDAHGAFGLFGESSGTLDVALRSASLAALETHLFETLPEPGDEPRVDGAVDATLQLRGGVSAFDLDATASLRGLVYERHRVATGSARASARGIATDDVTWDVALAADTLLLLDTRLDSLRASLVHALGETRLHADARGVREALALAGRAHRGADSTLLFVDSMVLGIAHDAWTLSQPTHAVLAGGRLEIAPFRLADARRAGFIEGEGLLGWGGAAGGALPLDFTVGAAGVPVHNLLGLVGFTGLEHGTLQGNARLTGTTAAPYLRGGFGIDSMEMNDARLARIDGILSYSDALLEVDVSALHEERPALTLSGSMPYDLRLQPVARRVVDAPVEFRARADSFPLAVALGIVDGFEGVSGVIDGELSATGVAGSTELAGGLRVRDGAATWVPVGVRYHDVAATFEVMQDRIFFVNANARASEPRGRGGLLRAASGSARVTGRIDFARPGDPVLDLRMLATDLLAANRRDVVLTASGETYLRGSYREPVVSATLDIESGAIYVDEMYRQYLVVGLDRPLLFDAVDTSLVQVRRVLPPSQNPFLRNLVVRDTRVRVGSGSWLRGREMNVEVTGDLTVALDRRAEDLRLTGVLEAQRGTYDLYYPPFTRRFQVRDGTVEFAGTPGIDPNLAITAVYRARTEGEPLDILAQLSGSLQAPRVSLSSNEQPPISESDLASYLFFGVPTYALNVTGGSGGGVAALGSQALAPTFLGSVASGLQTLAQRFGVVDYVGLTAAETGSVTSQQASPFDLFTGTNLEIGRYVGPDVFIATSQRLDGDFDPGVRVEWGLSRTFTAEFFVEDRFAREPGFGLTQASNFRKVKGFSLFREWSY